MPTYREILPPTRLIELVECCWISEQRSEVAVTQRVVPDGCADVLYARGASVASLSFVGPMTHYVDHEQQAGTCLIGVRFRPGLWARVLGVKAPEFRDRIVPLDAILPLRGRDLMSRLDDASRPDQWRRILEDWLPSANPQSPLERALRALEDSGGELLLDWAAGKAGLSVRHFRRVCLETTGLSPKLLARILRFRKASAQAPLMTRRHAALAADCGYADQSHFIADFRRLCGRTPNASA